MGTAPQLVGPPGPHAATPTPATHAAPADAAAAPCAMAAATGAEHYAIVLRAWEATTMERTLKDVLAAVTTVLTPVVPYVGLGIVAFDSPGSFPYALHHVDLGPMDAPKVMQMRAAHAEGRPPLPARPAASYDGSAFNAALNAGHPFTCDDVMAKSTWLEHESKLVMVGIRAYTAVPLVVQGRRIGNAMFCRREPDPFTPPQVRLLADASRALAVAVANAMANEEIKRLRDQLEAENVALRAQLAQPPSFGDIVGTSPALRRVLESVEQVAETGATVLVSGETGTGKEMIVRALHRLSGRPRAPLVKINCAAVPQTLIAAELFGHERGAFTGATERRKGRFEQAHGGTLFLDEVGELPPDVQVMLLRVLQEREFERLGGQETVRVDVRLVTATNRDLVDDVRAGRFRRDLFYRLNVFPIHLPPLRERPEDVPLLAAHFAETYGRRLNRPIDRIDRRSLHLLESYSWPGNVRELEHVIERAVILARNGTLRVDRSALAGSGLIGALRDGDLSADLRTREREALEAALSASGGRVAGPGGAAASLGLPASTLEFRIKRLGIDKFRFRRPASTS